MRKTGRANRCMTCCKLTSGTRTRQLEQEFSNFILFFFVFYQRFFLKKRKEIDGHNVFNGDYKR